MRHTIRFVVVAAGLLLCASAGAAPQGRYYGERGKVLVYRAGLDDGYRVGLREGIYDYRAGMKFGYRGRDKVRHDGFHAFGSRYRKEYRNGFRDGFRRGYQEGYRGNWRSNRPRPWFRFR